MRIYSDIKSGFLVILAAVVFASNAPAAGFNISWTGASNFTMTGMFGFNDTLVNTGLIDESDIDFIMIEGFENGISVGTWDDSAGFLTNLNFDTTVNQFIVGGNSFTASGQIWGFDGFDCSLGTGFGFFSGSATQGLCVNGSAASGGSIPVGQSTLMATAKISQVPEPTTILLLGLGLAGLGFARKRLH